MVPFSLSVYNGKCINSSHGEEGSSTGKTTEMAIKSTIRTIKTNSTLMDMFTVLVLLVAFIVDGLSWGGQAAR